MILQCVMQENISEIAESGGGIWSSVQHTRNASEEELLKTLLERINFLLDWNYNH
jgi:imidazolonepropionase-like amidohydrolase